MTSVVAMNEDLLRRASEIALDVANLEADLSSVRSRRDQAIIAASEAGMSYRAIGVATGLTHAMVGRIVAKAADER